MEKNNDANILIHGLKTNAEDMSNWLREGNIVVVDRGFGDSVEFLNDLGMFIIYLARIQWLTILIYDGRYQ
jgi:hypothetical protein